MIINKWKDIYFNFKKLKYLLTISFIFLYFSNNAQSRFKYKELPRQYKEKKEKDYFGDKLQKKRTNIYDLTNSLPVGYVENGTVDYTNYIQKGLNKHKIVRFPNFPILINFKGLSISSNSVLIFNNSSKLVMKPNSNQSYAALKLYNIHNASVYSPNIRGDRDLHKSGGQWGMGISIRGSSNVSIYNPRVVDCWGDGIYIGSFKNKCSRDIKIEGGILDYNRRNGISIVSGDSIIIESTRISNTSGHPPMSGIDIEPNNNFDVIDNVILDSIMTFNNERRGILINLNRLIGKNPKSVNIQINEHNDIGSWTGMFLAISKVKNGIPLNGIIEINGSKWVNNHNPLVYYNGPENKLNTIFKNISVLKKDSTGREILQRTTIPKIKKDLKRYNNIIFK